jgi:organic radical activating enzyme
MLKMIWVLGGEPLDQKTVDLLWLLKELKKHEVPIYLFTGKTKDFIKKEVAELCDFIKCGKYDESLKPNEPYIVHGIELHSTNQTIYTREELLK